MKRFLRMFSSDFEYHKVADGYLENVLSKMEETIDITSDVVLEVS